MAHGEGSGSDGEEAAWLDLVARFDESVPTAGEDVPWPEREDLPGPPVRVPPADGESPAPDPQPDASALADGLAAPPDPWPVHPGADAGEPDGQPMTGQPAFGPGQGPRDAPIPDAPELNHYIPPPAPPLPKFSLTTKIAWVALFGGPLYLIIATVAGWAVSGLAAFLAVAAFVGGFALLVLRMDSGPPKDRGPDDGAVV